MKRLQYKEKNVHCCFICEKGFVSRDELSIHLFVVHGIRNYAILRCKICGIKQINKQKMISHVNEQHNENYHYKCCRCPNSKTFASSSELDKHSIEFHKLAFRCRICKINKKLFYSFNDYQNHKYYEHGIKLSINCAICKSFLACSINNLKIHMNKCHPQRYQIYRDCRVCGLVFTSDDFRDHCKTFHKSIMKFLCICCGEYTNDHNKLRCHFLQKHIKNKNTECILCPKKFDHALKLYSHYAIVHNQLFYKQKISAINRSLCCVNEIFLK